MNEMIKEPLQLFAEGGEAQPEEIPAAESGAETGEAAAAPVQKQEPEAPAEAAPEQAPSGPEPSAPAPQEEPAPAAEETQAAVEAAAAEARARAVLAGWEREAAAMRAVYPGFDLCAELERSEEFQRLLGAGLGVRRAYEAAHLEEILSSAMRYAALRAGQRAAAAVEAQRARPQENPVSNRAAVSTATDVNSLTRSDILRILGEVSRGARITFK